MYLLRGILRDIEQLKNPTDAAHQLTARTAVTVKKLRKSLSGNTEPNTLARAGVVYVAQISTDLDALKKYSDEIGTILQANVQVHPFLLDWMLVMLVTFAETYLENALLLLTTAHPAWMVTNYPVVSGADVLKIEAAHPTETQYKNSWRLCASAGPNAF